MNNTRITFTLKTVFLCFYYWEHSGLKKRKALGKIHLYKKTTVTTTVKNVCRKHNVETCRLRNGKMSDDIKINTIERMAYIAISHKNILITD